MLFSASILVSGDSKCFKLGVVGHRLPEVLREQSASLEEKIEIYREILKPSFTNKPRICENVLSSLNECSRKVAALDGLEYNSKKLMTSKLTSMTLKVLIANYIELKKRIQRIVQYSREGVQRQCIDKPLVLSLNETEDDEAIIKMLSTDEMKNNLVNFLKDSTLPDLEQQQDEESHSQQMHVTSTSSVLIDAVSAINFKLLPTLISISDQNILEENIAQMSALDMTKYLKEILQTTVKQPPPASNYQNIDKFRENMGISRENLQKLCHDIYRQIDSEPFAKKLSQHDGLLKFRDLSKQLSQLKYIASYNLQMQPKQAWAKAFYILKAKERVKSYLSFIKLLKAKQKEHHERVQSKASHVLIIFY